MRIPVIQIEWIIHENPREPGSGVGNRRRKYLAVIARVRR